ncbi:peptidoglycan recognition family protein [Streptomyces scabiei]|uniref:peptidoglycan recognition protein family protein n=1 Tax=Streptomyces scabiei TaxID=1930 RepID=UPI001B32070B|nr:MULTISPECIES: peptidoglycan recognition family protein [Streptomyces]MBP5883184.1 N-acetylmuramoyl-L-alanine amidase [Streptomyces sp. LBUM 1487]MDX2626824.1 peptidoglycan recognition family protein [Streptomyces scabiei]MDX3162761.1 peptidoglycan recognition family protein [Streptomyces scabiei]
MKLITRKTLGWPVSAAPSQAKTKGTKVHYLGTEVSTALLKDHARCIALWKDIRKAHLANPTENYSDVAYNYAACVHGYVLEGRGVGRRTGANGNQTLNQGHYAVVGLIGSEGLVEPTDELLGAIRDAIEHLREHGAGDEVRGHRDGYATSCPGGELYAWVKEGAPRPESGGEEPPGPKPEEPPATGRPVVDLSELVKAAKADPPKKGTPVSYAGVRVVEAALVAEGLLAKNLADGHFGTATVDAYSRWQLRIWPGASTEPGGDADGTPGKTSLTKLGKRHNFDVKE